jgi:hypothetical protein
MAFRNHFVAAFYRRVPAGASRKNVFDSVRDLMRTNRSSLFEINRMFVRFDHMGSGIINANQITM